MKNWKTTLFGVLAAACGYLQHSSTGTLATIGGIGTYVFTMLLGASAGDASNTK